MQNLMLTGEALRLGGWVHGAPMIPHVMAARPGEGPPRPRLPRVQRQAGDVALEALAAGARVAAELRRHRRRAGGPVPAVRHRHGRGRRPGASRRSSAPGGTYADAEVFAQAYKDTATRRDATCATPAHHPPEAIEYTKEICRYLVETYGRFPAHTDAFYLPGHLGAVLAPGDRVLRALRQPGALAPRRPRARRSGSAADEHAGRSRHRAPARRRRTAGQRDRPDDRPDAVHAHPPPVAAGARGRRSGWASSCRWPRSTSCSSTSSTSCAGRSSRATPARPAQKLNYRYLFFESNFDGPWQHYIDAFAYVIPQRHPLRLGPRHRLPRPAAGRAAEGVDRAQQHGGRAPTTAPTRRRARAWCKGALEVRERAASSCAPTPSA